MAVPRHLVYRITGSLNFSNILFIGQSLCRNHMMQRNVFKPEWSNLRFVGYVQDAEEERDRIFQQVKDIRNIKEGSFNPAKLHLVQRVKSLNGRPYWEKLVMKNLKLDGKPSSYAILKNTPSINRIMWSVKHLIKVKPITFPYGLPQEAFTCNITKCVSSSGLLTTLISAHRLGTFTGELKQIKTYKASAQRQRVNKLQDSSPQRL